MAVLGYLPRTSFWCTFSAWFFHENVPYLISYQWKKFQCHTFFPLPDIKQNMLLSSHSDSCKVYLGSRSKAMTDREKKRER